MASYDVDDTIVAIASPPGVGLRGIVRISGPNTIDCVDQLFHPCDDVPIHQYPTNAAINGELMMEEGTLVPCRLLLWPTKQSYTRQPTAEIHTIGSTPVLQSIVSEICRSGARLAKPGEFTLRAFLSGRIDLTQAEAVLAVIDSEGEKQFDTALQQLAGGLAGPLGNIRDELMGILAELEAGLDFVEEDIEFITQQELASRLNVIKNLLESITSQIVSRDLAVGSVKVVLVGLPNSGKSSLFNALTDSKQAIVTDVAGTTTDFVSAQLVINSIEIELVDTAGAEESTGEITQQAQDHRSRQQAQAQLRLFCIDRSTSLDPWEVEQLNRIAQKRHSDLATIIVLTKSDLVPTQSNGNSSLLNEIQATGYDGPVVCTSSVESRGLRDLREQISTCVLDSQLEGQTVIGSTVLRASQCLRDASEAVEHALEATHRELGDEIVAAELNQALEELGQVVGAIYTDDILDLVFGRFCIGK